MFKTEPPCIVGAIDPQRKIALEKQLAANALIKQATPPPVPCEAPEAFAGIALPIQLAINKHVVAVQARREHDYALWKQAYAEWDNDPLNARGVAYRAFDDALWQTKAAVILDKIKL